MYLPPLIRLDCCLLLVAAAVALAVACRPICIFPAEMLEIVGMSGILQLGCIMGCNDAGVRAHRLCQVCGVVMWCGVVWCGVVWCGVVWCGEAWGGVAAVAYGFLLVSEAWWVNNEQSASAFGKTKEQKAYYRSSVIREARTFKRNAKVFETPL